MLGLVSTLKLAGPGASMPDDGDRGHETMRDLGSGPQRVGVPERTASVSEGTITVNEGTRFILKGSGILALALFLLWVGGEREKFNKSITEQAILAQRVTQLEQSMIKIEGGIDTMIAAQKETSTNAKLAVQLANDTLVAIANKGIIVRKGE